MHVGESSVGLLMLQISVELSFGFSVIGVLQWEPFSNISIDSPPRSMYSLMAITRVRTASDSGILGTGRRVTGSELGSETFVRPTRNCIIGNASLLSTICSPT